MHKSHIFPGAICSWTSRILRAVTMLVLIISLTQDAVGDVYLCVLTLGLFTVPEILERRFGLWLPEVLETILALFIFSSEILGEILAFYARIPWWDVMLHGVSGFLFASVGFSLTAGQNGDRYFPGLLAAFCFSMSAGVLWELLEWGADLLFGLDMQKDTVITGFSSISLDPGGGNTVYSLDRIARTAVCCADGTWRILPMGGYLDVGLQDTMGDLLINLLGAALFVAVGYVHVRRGGTGAAGHVIPVFVKKNPHEEQ